jgi:RNA polymerase sigma-70 factor (ECF subfamily)
MNLGAGKRHILAGTMKAAAKGPATGELEGLDDGVLLIAVAAGDRPAFEVFYRRFYRRLYGFLARFLNERGQIEEVLDDVMMVVFRDAGRFEHRSRVSTWLFGIAYRSAQHARRPRSSDLRLEAIESPEALAVKVGIESAGPARFELRQLIDQALALLSPEQRLVVELTYFEDCSYQEIAAIADCPVNTVKTRMFHARKRLREILGGG